jgi:hypothetical protein
MCQNFDVEFNPLWSDIVASETFPVKRPLLAHYTSIGTFEQIVKNGEIWFSNPLYMNDMDELRFGMNEGAYAFRMHTGIRQVCGGDKRYEILLNRFNSIFKTFLVLMLLIHTYCAFQSMTTYIQTVDCRCGADMGVMGTALPSFSIRKS